MQGVWPTLLVKFRYISNSTQLEGIKTFWNIRKFLLKNFA